MRKLKRFASLIIVLLVTILTLGTPLSSSAPAAQFSDMSIIHRVDATAISMDHNPGHPQAVTDR